jgi:hypothetical protein
MIQAAENAINALAKCAFPDGKRGCSFKQTGLGGTREITVTSGFGQVTLSQPEGSNSMSKKLAYSAMLFIMLRHAFYYAENKYGAEGVTVIDLEKFGYEKFFHVVRTVCNAKSYLNAWSKVKSIDGEVQWSKQTFEEDGIVKLRCEISCPFLHVAMIMREDSQVPMSLLESFAVWYIATAGQTAGWFSVKVD